MEPLTEQTTVKYLCALIVLGPGVGVARLGVVSYYEWQCQTITSVPCLGMSMTVGQVFFYIFKVGVQSNRLMFPFTRFDSRAAHVFALHSHFPAASFPAVFSRDVSVHGELFLFFSYINAMK